MYSILYAFNLRVCMFIHYTIVFYTLTPFSFLFHLSPVRFLSSSLYAPFSSNSPLLPLPSPIPPFLYSSLHFLSSRPPYPLLPFSTPSLSSPHRLHYFPLHSLSPPFPHSFLSFIFTPSPSLPPSPPLFDCFTSPLFLSSIVLLFQELTHSLTSLLCLVFDLSVSLHTFFIFLSLPPLSPDPSYDKFLICHLSYPVIGSQIHLIPSSLLAHVYTHKHLTMFIFLF